MSNDNRVFLSNGQPVDDDESHKELRPDGLQKDYVVLSEAERKAGFVRPVRRAYRHVGGLGPKYPLRDCTPEEVEDYGEGAKYEAYPKEMEPHLGKYWSKAELDNVGKGCGAVTTMHDTLAETYARAPHFYSGTFCATCRKHYPVGEHGEFVWEGTDERVGT